MDAGAPGGHAGALLTDDRRASGARDCPERGVEARARRSRGEGHRARRGRLGGAPGGRSWLRTRRSAGPLVAAAPRTTCGVAADPLRRTATSLSGLEPTTTWQTFVA